jgi:hypothetical protein
VRVPLDLRAGRGGPADRAPGDYLHDERPDSVGTDRIFVVLKGPRRGRPLSAEGPDAILDGARA